jgi:hypothetical protein
MKPDIPNAHIRKPPTKLANQGTIPGADQLQIALVGAALLGGLQRGQQLDIDRPA